MEDKLFNYNKVKKTYLRFLTSQEVMSEPFRDKLGQLNKFYLPISKMIAKNYLKKKNFKKNQQIIYYERSAWYSRYKNAVSMYKKFKKK